MKRYFSLLGLLPFIYFIYVAYIFSNNIFGVENLWIIWAFVYYLIFSAGINFTADISNDSFKGLNHGAVGIQLFIAITFMLWDMDFKQIIIAWGLFLIFFIFKREFFVIWKVIGFPSQKGFQKGVQERTISSDKSVNIVIFYIIVFVASYLSHVVPRIFMEH
ncbi:hypothetical protein [Cellvibrio japonicus]|uniref:Uncharacterized protein n=1 Tax=Cellvibrio japonicus (strain Ueda107) TaxID=498211 RepID=B3PLF5_CELJU|nr:hypothetical protein [Cellvibrio japonicus]ACE83854.1 hypothetical protein CJA_0979 [Cellvibrio japonicus Ueda107]QEI11607.1 hypothetical protein FY117_04765 [Cellvibrio japonicus]QEI15181.1 hypothetical protein FY116_04765 [Cellvibrio japonicus]QEI18761.1 hypothetical protein FY115_04765 [Cellvibrio japonicus]